MKEINFNIVTEWSEVTLEMFDQISQITGEPHEQVPKLLSILSNASEEDILSIPASKFESLGINQKLSFLAKAPRKALPMAKIEICGKKFDVSLYPQKWTAGQYLDYSSIIGTETDKKIAKLIACFCVPEGHRYGEGYDFDEVVNLIYKNIDIETALGYAGFFQLQLTAFEKALKDYSGKRKKRSTRRQEKQSKKTRQADSTSSGTALS